MFTSTFQTAFAALNYSYDANGNATTDGKYCYQYNEANQLKRVTICSSGQIVSDYVYDYNGNRIEKKLYNNGSLQKTVYSPNDTFEATKLASNGATTNTSYYFVNEELAAKKNSDGSKNYFLNDSLGSIGYLTNSSGTVLEATQYYPYGLVRAGGTKNKFLYTGQENDPETGLDYYNFRYYNPQLGRFIQPDDQLQTPYDPQSLNNYSYVNNNPLTYNDPSGHFAWIPLIILGAAGLGWLNAVNAYKDYNPNSTFSQRFWAGAGGGVIGGLGAGAEMASITFGPLGPYVAAGGVSTTQAIYQNYITGRRGPDLLKDVPTNAALGVVAAKLGVKLNGLIPSPGRNISIPKNVFKPSPKAISWAKRYILSNTVSNGVIYYSWRYVFVPIYSKVVTK